MGEYEMDDFRYDLEALIKFHFKLLLAERIAVGAKPAAAYAELSKKFQGLLELHGDELPAMKAML